MRSSVLSIVDQNSYDEKFQPIFGRIGSFTATVGVCIV